MWSNVRISVNECLLKKSSVVVCLWLWKMISELLVIHTEVIWMAICTTHSFGTEIKGVVVLVNHELKTQFSRELKRNYQHISVIRDKSGESSLLDKVAGECHDIILMAFHFSFDVSFLEYTSSPPNCINVVYFVISTNRIKVIMWGLCLILFSDTHEEISLMLKFVTYSTSVNF